MKAARAATESLASTASSRSGCKPTIAAWNDICHNYPTRTRTGLKFLLDEFRPDSRGQLLLWQGEPGTGKTWALRGLTRAWKDWCWIE